MAEIWNHVYWMLIFLRDQCMPVAIGDTPGPLDYAIVGLAALGTLVATVWFAWGLMGRDTSRNDAVKHQVLED